MKLSSSGFAQQAEEGEKKCLNSELWHACAGPLVSLPPVGSCVVYFPQGHSEQVAASTNKEIDAHIPNYPSLPPQLICQLHDVTMHADLETDEVYAKMTLQPLTPQEQKDVCALPVELGAPSKQPTNYFCKTLTASDTSTHGGFSVPRRAAERVFPPLDYSHQPPAQELIVRDLHDNEWKFRHIFRGQPKRHLLTTGWSVFVSAKRLVAGDSVIFIWNEKNQLLLGIRHANRPQAVMPSSVLSSDSMYIGMLAAAAATNSRFTVFYNPRASSSEFVVALEKYVKAVYHTRVSVGMRFRMLFEMEESSVRRFMGTITGISDSDPVRWLNSHWRSVKVSWDESTSVERQPRVSLWEIEPLTTFPTYPSPFPLRLKRPWPSALPSLTALKDGDVSINSPLMWLQRDVGDFCMPSLNFQGFGLRPCMRPRLDSSMLGLQPNLYQTMAFSPFQDPRALEKHANPFLLQFQQDQDVSCQPVAPIQSQMLQQAQSQHTLVQSLQDNQSVADNQAQGEILQQQLQNCHPCEDRQRCRRHHHHQQLQQFEQLQNQFSDQQQISKVISTLTHFGSSTPSRLASLQTVSSTCPQQILSNLPGGSVTAAAPMHSLLNSFSQDGGCCQFDLPGCDMLVSSSSSLSKQVAVKHQLPSGTAQCILPQIEELGTSQSRVSQLSTLLPSLPGREYPRNNVLFGMNVQQSELPNLRSDGSQNDSLSMPFACSVFPSATGMDFLPSSDMTTSRCIDETGFLRSSENVENKNLRPETFIKVHKSGSLVRSLDISKFSSYHELRSELAHVFGLEGQLEDSVRSGWQLVFVDRENDVLLLGDDPWQEFVNNVWYIKILSPREVQQMGKEGLHLPNSVPKPRLGRFDDYTSQQESINNTNGFASVASLNY